MYLIYLDSGWDLDKWWRSKDDESLQRTTKVIYVISSLYIYSIYIYIWVNYNISLTWIKVIWGWFPLLTMINQICIYIYVSWFGKFFETLVPPQIGDTKFYWSSIPERQALQALQVGRCFYQPHWLKKNFWPRYINENKIYIKILEH